MGLRQQLAAPRSRAAATPLTRTRPQGVLERQDKNKRIRFVDIADLDYDPMANMGVVRHVRAC